MNYYHVGQKVSHQGFGNGEVIDVEENNEVFPVVVQFDEGTKSFTIDGKLELMQYPSLSQEPHKELELKEIILFKEGELVWVRFYGSESWEARYYAKSIGGSHYVFINQQNSGKYRQVIQIRKFDDRPF